MTNIPISQLPAAQTPLTGAELTPLVQSGVTVQSTVSAIAATVSTSQIYVEQFGATPGSLTIDSWAAFNSALNSGATVVHMQGKSYRISQPLTIPSGVTLIGDSFIPDLPDGLGSRMVFDLSVGTCVQVGSGGNLTGTGFINCIVDRAAGTVPAASIGVLVKDGYAVNLDCLGANRHSIGFEWSATAPNGINSFARKLYTGAITDAHVVASSWPELFLSQCRLGSNGTNDVNCTAYLRITGGGTGGSGPNGIFLSQCQLNQGVNAPSHGVEWVNVSHTDSNALEFKFSQCHIEGVSSAVFFTDATCVILNRLAITDCTVNCPSTPLWALNAATQPSDWTIHGNEFYVSTFVLAPTAQFSKVDITNNVVLSAGSITAASNSNLYLAGNVWAGLTIAGAANFFIADRLNAGVFTNSSSGTVIFLNPDLTSSFGGTTSFNITQATQAQFGDSAFFAQLQAGNPDLSFAAGDFLAYDRSLNNYNFNIANNLSFRVSATGVLIANAGSTTTTFGATQTVSVVPFKALVTTVTNLPSAVTMGAGSTAFVNNATGSTFGNTVVGGGATNVPVYSDGAAWRIG